VGSTAAATTDLSAANAAAANAVRIPV